MHVPDEWASVIVSVFGIVYAPEHNVALAGTIRRLVLRGCIVLSAWIPGSFLPAMGPALSGFPPPSSGPPSRWGDVDDLRDLVNGHGLEIGSHSLEVIAMEFAEVDTAAHFFVTRVGQVRIEESRLLDVGMWEDLETSMRDLVRSRATSVEGGITIERNYLLATLRLSPNSQSRTSRA